MHFYSILYEAPLDRGNPVEAPAFFADLNCAQVVAAITAEKAEYNLANYFYDCLSRVDAITYRHEAMRDLEIPSLFASVGSFAKRMRELREQLRLSKKMRYQWQTLAWRLAAATTYVEAVSLFNDELAAMEVRSRAFIGFRGYIAQYVHSYAFMTLSSETHRLMSKLAAIEYCVLTRGSSFTVRRYDNETDYSVEIEKTFEKFKQGAVKDYKVKFSTSVEMNSVEERILGFVAQLYPEVFNALDEFCRRRGNFTNETITAFDREVQFYIAYLEYIAPLRQMQLPFCYPKVSAQGSELFDYDGFDLALAHKLLARSAAVVRNDFELSGQERVLVVSGPNQGGKTTFARAFGQVHYLGSIGCPVPGKQASLLLFDRLFTHFEKEERVENLRGKLEDDLIRIRAILSEATARSVIIMNEVFTSTTIQDEIFLSKKIMERIIQLGAACVWVTFVDELASFGPEAVSMVSTVVPDNPALRTFKVVRRSADGLAYAMAIARKYALTYDAIYERVKS